MSLAGSIPLDARVLAKKADTQSASAEVVEFPSCAPMPDQDNQIYLPLVIVPADSQNLEVVHPSLCYDYDMPGRKLEVRGDIQDAVYNFPASGGGTIPFVVAPGDRGIVASIGDLAQTLTGRFEIVMDGIIYRTVTNLTVPENVVDYAELTLPGEIFHGQPVAVGLAASDWSGIRTAQAWYDDALILSSIGQAVITVPAPGDGIITYRVEDGLGNVYNGSRGFTAQNLPPQVDVLTIQIVPGTGLVQVARFTDPNGDGMAAEVAGELPAGYVLSPTGLSVPSDESLTGREYSINLIVTDEYGARTEQPVQFSIVDVAAPSVQVSLPQMIYHNIPFTIDFQVQDPSGVSLAELWYNGLLILDEQGQAQVTVPVPGPGTFHYVAEDAHGNSTVGTIPFSAQNLSPEIQALVSEIAAGTPGLVPVASFTDQNLDELTPEVVGYLPEGYSLTSEGLSIPAGASQVGQRYTPLVRVTDQHGGVAEKTLDILIRDLTPPEWQTTYYSSISPTTTQLGSQTSEPVTNLNTANVRLFQIETIDGEQQLAPIEYLQLPLENGILVEAAGTKIGYNPQIIHRLEMQGTGDGAITDLSGNPFTSDKVVERTYGADPFWILHRYDLVGINHAPQFTFQQGFTYDRESWWYLIIYNQSSVVPELGGSFLDSQVLLTDGFIFPYNPEGGAGTPFGIYRDLEIEGHHYDFAILIREVVFQSPTDTAFYVMPISQGLFDILSNY